MGSNLNFKNFGNDPQPATAGGGDSGTQPSSLPLTRQPSVYSLTFDEFQNSIGGSRKDFGSMNMDELLKSIWSAEDNQNFASTSGDAPQGVGSLQKQGSLILPRTLSQKTVDDVWKDMSKEYYGEVEKNLNGDVSGFGVPQRQPTLGEITLEEFLVRAGVVREEAQLVARANNVGFFGDVWHPVTSSNIGFSEFTNPTATQSASNLPLNLNGVRLVAESHQIPQQHQQQQQQQILPKPPVLAYGNQMEIPSNGQRTKGGNGISNQAMKNNNYNNNNNNNNNMAQDAVLQAGGLGMVGLGGNNGVGVRTGSPAVSSDKFTNNSNGDMSPVLPVPYVFNGGLRGKRSAGLEKVVERRQRRMIKNRESAARSRARKQAYTTELEEEVAKLKEEHEELQRKQVEIMEMQKNQVLEMMIQQKGGKRQCLRRTQTGPW